MEVGDLFSFVERAQRLGRIPEIKLACQTGFEPIRAMERYTDWVMIHGVDLETEIIVPFSQIEAMRMIPKTEG